MIGPCPSTTAVVVAETLEQHLMAVGPTTKAGRRRAAFDMWLAVTGRVERLAQAIGLERRQRSVPSAHEYVVLIKNDHHRRVGGS